MPMMPTECMPAQTAEDNTLGHFLYGLMSAFPLFFIPVLFSFWINLIQKGVNPNSLLASHLRWQRISALGLCLFLLIGYAANPLWLSISIYVLGVSWFSYRIFKGWLSLNDGVSI